MSEAPEPLPGRAFPVSWQRFVKLRWLFLQTPTSPGMGGTKLAVLADMENREEKPSLLFLVLAILAAVWPPIAMVVMVWLAKMFAWFG
jgi:hypothetical protein